MATPHKYKPSVYLLSANTDLTPARARPEPALGRSGEGLCLCTEGVCEALIRNAAKNLDVTKEAIPVSVKTYPRSQGTHRRTSDSGSMFCEGHQVWDLLKGQGWEKSWSPRAKSCATEYVPHW